VYFLLPVLMLTPLVSAGVFTTPPASAARFLGIITPLSVYAGIAAVRIGEFCAGRDMRRVQLVALAAVGGVSILGLDFYFGRYAHGGYFSDQNTRHAERYGETARAFVPEGARIYWRITDVLNPGHPTLDWGLKDYVLYAVENDGRTGRVLNPHRLPETTPDVAYMFAGRAVAEVLEFERACPGGGLAGSRNPLNNEIDLVIYYGPAAFCELGPVRVSQAPP
jgi:hypothetical protein